MDTVVVQRLTLQGLTHFTEFLEILKKLRVGCTIDFLRIFSHFQVFLAKTRTILNRAGYYIIVKIEKVPPLIPPNDENATKLFLVKCSSKRA